MLSHMWVKRQWLLDLTWIWGAENLAICEDIISKFGQKMWMVVLHNPVHFHNSMSNIDELAHI